MAAFVAGLFALGVISGTVVRLLIFVVVLIVAGLIVAWGSAAQGVGIAALNTAMALVTLQIGYGLGVGLRCWWRARGTHVESRLGIGAIAPNPESAGDRARPPANRGSP